MENMVNKIGQSKFAKKFTEDILATPAGVAGLIISAVVTIFGIIMFQIVPLFQYQPFHWNIPEWMCSPVLETVSAVFVFVMMSVYIFTLVVAYCATHSVPEVDYED